MADVKISELGAAATVNDADILPMVANGSTVKVTAELLKTHAIGETDISEIGDGTPTGAINTLNNNKASKDSTYGTGDTAETAIADGDYFPYYDISANAKRKTLWSNIVNTLKEIFALKSALTDGSVTKVGTGSVGGTTTPVYIKNGVPTAMTGALPVALGGTGNTTVDNVPTEDSAKMVKSGGVYSAIKEVSDHVDEIIQESVFTTEEVDGVWYLIWHGASGECPYSVTQDGTDFNLNFTYNI